MRRGFEEELLVNDDGTTDHVSCVNHCLLYTFDACTQAHPERCKKCDQLFNLLGHLKETLPTEHLLLQECEEKLTYFLAHQAQKVYLNSQFKAQLSKLDEKGVMILADYKMKILPKSAREQKQEFFGKRGWSLHHIS